MVLFLILSPVRRNSGMYLCSSVVCELIRIHVSESLKNGIFVRSKKGFKEKECDHVSDLIYILEHHTRTPQSNNTYIFVFPLA